MPEQNAAGSAIVPPPDVNYYPRAAGVRGLALSPPGRATQGRSGLGPALARNRDGLQTQLEIVIYRNPRIPTVGLVVCVRAWGVYFHTPPGNLFPCHG